MPIVNLTPHAITIQVASQGFPFEPVYVTIPPSGTVARVMSSPGRKVGNVDGCPVYSSPVYGAVEGLPEPAEDTTYIVSAMVAAALARDSREGENEWRPDVVSPGTGPNDGAIRDDGGRIVAVTRLIRAY